MNKWFKKLILTLSFVLVFVFSISCVYLSGATDGTLTFSDGTDNVYDNITTEGFEVTENYNQTSEITFNYINHTWNINSWDVNDITPIIVHGGTVGDKLDTSTVNRYWRGIVVEYDETDESYYVSEICEIDTTSTSDENILALEASTDKGFVFLCWSADSSATTEQQEAYSIAGAVSVGDIVTVSMDPTTVTSDYNEAGLGTISFSKKQETETSPYADTDIVIVMDISNTMNATLSENTRYESAMVAVESFIDSLLNEASEESTHLGFVAFNTNAHEILPLQSCTNNTSAELSEQIKTATGNNINAEDYSNSRSRFTNVQAGLKMAEDMLAESENEYQYIIFVSGGYATTYLSDSTTYTGYEPYSDSGTPGEDGVFYDYVLEMYCSYGVSYSDKASIRAREEAENVKESGVTVFSIGVGVETSTIDDLLTEASGFPFSIVDRTSETYEIGAGDSFDDYKNWLKNSIGSGYYYDIKSETDLEAAFDSALTEIPNITAEDSARGTCGDNAIWVFDSASGTLTIRGSGDMYNYGKYSDKAPWCDYINSITSVIVESGITSIGENAFWDTNSIECVYISDTVSSIGTGAFDGCSSALTEIIVESTNTSFIVDDYGVLYDYNKTEIIKSEYFAEETAYVMPETVVTVRPYAFQSQENLISVEFSLNLETIGRAAFISCGLTEINIPYSVTYIDDYVFAGNENATEIILGDSVAFVGKNSFWGCKNVVNLEFGGALETISSYAFSDLTKIEHIKLRYGITNIEYGAFSGNSSLKSIELPVTAGTISGCAFEDCTSLTDVYFKGSEEEWEGVNVGDGNDCFLNARIHFVRDYGTFGDNITWSFGMDYTLYLYGTGAMPDGLEYDEDAGEFVVDEETGGPVVNIPWYEYKNEIKKVVIDEGITTVGKGAFYGHYYLEELQLSSTVEMIDMAALCDCLRFEKLTNTDSVKIINGGVFDEMGIKNLTLPANLTELNGYSEEYDPDFNMCIYLESLTIPSTVGGVNAVISPINSSIRNVYNRSMTALIKFEKENVSEYWWGDEATAEYYTISMSAAFDAIENELTDEELQALTEEKLIAHYGSLENIPEPVLSETVPSYITVYCYKDSAQHAYCLENGINFKLIDSHDHADSDNDKYCDICADCLFFVGSVDGSDNYVWSVDYRTGIFEIDCIDEIPDYKVSKYAPWYPHRKYITKIVIGQDVKSIGDLAFYGCANASEVVLGENVERIGKYAFNGCDALTVIEIPASVKTIDSKAFHSCDALSEFAVSEDNQFFTSYEGVLYNKDITELIKYPLAKEDEEFFIPSTVISIAADAFNGSEKLTYISIEGTIDTIKESAFQNCKSLQEIVLGSSVTTIEPYAFYGCSALTTVSLTNSLASIGDWAFYKCSKLATVNYNGTADEWDAYDLGNSNRPLKKADIVCNDSSELEPADPDEGELVNVMMFAMRRPAAHEHSYEGIITAPTCTEKGYTTYSCECGESYISDETEVVSHEDVNGDGNCDMCAAVLDEPIDCDHLCHKDGFLWKLIRFFIKLFRIQRECDCGIKHY